MPPSNTKYGLFVIVLGKNQGKNSQLLDLDDSFAASKPNQCEVLYYRGVHSFFPTLFVYHLCHLV